MLTFIFAILFATFSVNPDSMPPMQEITRTSPLLTYNSPLKTYESPAFKPLLDIEHPHPQRPLIDIPLNSSIDDIPPHDQTIDNNTVWITLENLENNWASLDFNGTNITIVASSLPHNAKINDTYLLIKTTKKQKAKRLQRAQQRIEKLQQLSSPKAKKPST